MLHDILSQELEHSNQGELYVYGTSSAGEIYHFPTDNKHDILSQELKHSVRVSSVFMVPQVLGKYIISPLLTTKIIHDILSQELEHSIRVSCMFMVPQVLEKSIIFPH